MTEIPTKEQLEKYATDNDEVHFIKTDKGRLVVFNPDRWVWNAYGKESIDSEDWLTDDQWYDFIRNEDYLFLELEDKGNSELVEYCKENKIKMEYEY